MKLTAQYHQPRAQSRRRRCRRGRGTPLRLPVMLVPPWLPALGALCLGAAAAVALWGARGQGRSQVFAARPGARLRPAVADGFSFLIHASTARVLPRPCATAFAVPVKRRRRRHGLPRGALAISEERTRAAAYAAWGFALRAAARGCSLAPVLCSRARALPGGGGTGLHPASRVQTGSIAPRGGRRSAGAVNSHPQSSRRTHFIEIPSSEGAPGPPGL